MTSPEPWRLGAARLAGLVAGRELSASEVVEAHLARIAEVNTRVNALVGDLAAQARADAAELDRAREPLGPLHGVPVSVKTSLDVAGSPTTSGNPSGAGRVPQRIGPEAEGLARAGAVAVGRGNAPDFSLRLHTDNDLHGPTLNPWDGSRSPGGSGGGEAVAVATGMVALGLGGDVGGSQRIPAQWNGVATLKATPGRIPSADSFEPREPTLALSLMTSFGPFARSVEDLRLAYLALARRDPRDPWSLPFAPLEPPATPSFGAAVLGDGEAVRRAAAALGAEDAGPGGADALADVWAQLFLTDVAADWPALEPLLSADARRWLSDAFTARPPVEHSAELLGAYRERHRIAAEWSAFQAGTPLLVAPVMTISAPRVGFDLEGPEAIARLLGAGRFVFAANVLGLPSAVVPVGVGDDGLPLAVQLIGPRFGEALCLEAAAVVEAAYGTLTPIDPR